MIMYYRKTTKLINAVLAASSLLLMLVQLGLKAEAASGSFPLPRYQLFKAQLDASAMRTNGKIAFIRYISGVSGLSDSLDDIYVMNPDGSNQRRLTFTQNLCGSFQAAYSFGPVWSPDGKKIAFVGEFECGHPKLYVMNADGTRITKVYGGEPSPNTITWSPDGKKLAFDHGCVYFPEDPVCPIDIYTVNIDGTDVTRLTANTAGADDISPAWSPDGSRIAFTAIRSGDAPSIYVMNPDGSNRVRLTTSGYDYIPAWSPDGTKIAFDRGTDVYVMNADGSNLRAVTTGGQVSWYGVAWSPDSTKILFNHQVNQLTYSLQVFAINIDGTGQRNLSNNPYYDQLNSWQPLFTSDTNPIDDPKFFVSQHYDDFLSRDPDASGYAFWTNEITSCGSDAKCIDTKRVNVSAAYFLSTEFQETGYLVYRFYNAALNRTNGLPRFIEFMRDTQSVSNGVIVNADGWQQLLEQNKQAFAQGFVTRKEFTDLYPETMTPGQYVDALYQHAGITPTAAERQAALDEFNTPTGARARVMRRVAENQTLFTREFNRAFVLMQYFGYLRRNPDDPPDNNVNGYNFWLGKLNQFGGNYQAAEMVKAFIVSSEYRQRFGL